MQPDRKLLDKYLTGNCTEAEKHAVEQWLAEGHFDENLAPAPQEIQAVEQVWDRLRQSPQSRFFANSRVVWLAGIAASVLLVMGFWFLMPQKRVGRIAQVNSGTPEKRIKVVNVENGRKHSLTLPDGSKVHLNAGSQLRYAEDFDRNIELTGEGYFEITRDTLHPFTISTSQSTVTVLGTSFNLKAYSTDRQTEVVVKEGKVKLADRQDANRNILLTTDQRGTLQPGQMPRKSGVYAARFFAWRENKMIFQDQTLSEIVPVLERWYHVEIDVKSEELNNLRYIGTFQDRSLKQVMDAMSYALDFKYKLNHNNLTIY